MFLSLWGAHTEYPLWATWLRSTHWWQIWATEHEREAKFGFQQRVERLYGRERSSEGPSIIDVTQASQILDSKLTIPFTQPLSTIVTFWTAPSPLYFMMSLTDTSPSADSSALTVHNQKIIFSYYLIRSPVKLFQV